MKLFSNAAEAWLWYLYHPALSKSGADPWIEMTPNMVDPEIGGINTDNPEKNTKLEWWIEGGPHSYDPEQGLTCAHDWDLDCGGDTAEQAVLIFCGLVYEKYGDYDL